MIFFTSFPHSVVQIYEIHAAFMYSWFHLHPTRVRYEPIQWPAPSWLASSLGHFRVPLGLCFKTRVSAQPLIWKSFSILKQIKLIFTRKVVHLASFWKWGFLELGSGLLISAMHRYQSGKGSNPGILKLLYAFFSQLHKLRLYGCEELLWSDVTRDNWH